MWIHRRANVQVLRRLAQKHGVARVADDANRDKVKTMAIRAIGKWWFGLSQMHTPFFCVQAEFGLYNTKGITQLGHKHKWMGLWL